MTDVSMVTVHILRSKHYFCWRYIQGTWRLLHITVSNDKVIKSQVTVKNSYLPPIWIQKHQ